MRICLFLAAANFALAAGGCGASTSVSGTVTFDNVPIEDGYITFFPDEKGLNQAASPIKNGAYQLAFPKPGTFVAEITGQKKIVFSLSSEEMARKFKEAKSKGNASGIVESADVVPANAIGNRQKVTIKPGSQTLDFHLKKP